MVAKSIQNQLNFGAPLGIKEGIFLYHYPIQFLVFSSFIGTIY